MPINPTPLTQRSSWKALEEHYQKVRDLHLRTLFAEEPGRGERFALAAAGIYRDYSKNRITDETLRLLLALAADSGLLERIEAMFRGDNVNVTENPAVRHLALSAPKKGTIFGDCESGGPEWCAGL